MIHEKYDNIQGEQSHHHLCSCSIQGGHKILVDLVALFTQHLTQVVRKAKSALGFSFNAIGRKFVFWRAF